MEQPENKRSGESPGIIPHHGGYRGLKPYQMAEIVHDATVEFQDYLRRQSLSVWGKDHARALEKGFLDKGGFTEKLYRARSERLEWKRQT